MSIAHNDPFIVSGGSDSAIKVWNMQSRHQEFTLKSIHCEGVLAVCITSNSSGIMSAHANRKIALWSSANREIDYIIESNFGRIRCLILSKDENYLVFGGKEKRRVFIISPLYNSFT